MAAAAVSIVPRVSISQPRGNERAESILEISEHLRSTGRDEVPEEMKVRETDRPTLRHDEWKAVEEIPLIDLSMLQVDRAKVLKQVRVAVSEWGFFQILNHGLSAEVLKEAQAQAVKFFELPLEIKDRFAGTTMHGYIRNCSKESFLSLHWAEMLCVQLENLEKSISQVWLDGNQEFRDAVTNFSSGAEVIAKQLCELIAESLGLSVNFFTRHGIWKTQILRMNFYPACPRPTDSLGCASHSDPNFITVLLQDEVGGLQIEKDGQWIGIKPLEGALVVNIGDMLHAWTNGVCSSVLHRVVVNKEVPRLAIASFQGVANSQFPISPPDQLVDENHPRLYKTLTYVEYMKQISKYREDNKTDKNGPAILGAKFKFEN